MNVNKKEFIQKTASGETVWYLFFLFNEDKYRNSSLKPPEYSDR